MCQLLMAGLCQLKCKWSFCLVIAMTQADTPDGHFHVFPLWCLCRGAEKTRGEQLINKRQRPCGVLALAPVHLEL